MLILVAPHCITKIPLDLWGGEAPSCTLEVGFKSRLEGMASAHPGDPIGYSRTGSREIWFEVQAASDFLWYDLYVASHRDRYLCDQKVCTPLLGSAGTNLRMASLSHTNLMVESSIRYRLPTRTSTYACRIKE
jgi:hypothetical protein